MVRWEGVLVEGIEVGDDGFFKKRNGSLAGCVKRILVLVGLDSWFANLGVDCLDEGGL